YAFADQLIELGVNATVRRNRGTDIAAACGQLAAGQPVKLGTKSSGNATFDDESFENDRDR
ncbi:MAG: hypothetical protein EBY80_10045, partial [Actinobacteria bacterium]|nr:hypothetical protein [Actinomycetota bacterium]